MKMIMRTANVYAKSCTNEHRPFSLTSSHHSMSRLFSNNYYSISVYLDINNKVATSQDRWVCGHWRSRAFSLKYAASRR